MNNGVKDYTLLEQTILRLIGVKKLQIAQCGDSPPVSERIKAPSLEHLDFGKVGGAPRVGAKPTKRKCGKVKPVGPPRPVEHDDTEKPPLGWKAARLAAYLLVIAGAIVVNEFYGYPLRDSRWLKLGTYRAAIENVLESEESALVEGTQQPRIMNVTGIVYSSDKPSAMIGDRIVHAGDVVSDATIVRIGPKEIVFKDGEHTWTQKVQ